MLIACDFAGMLHAASGRTSDAARDIDPLRSFLWRINETVQTNDYSKEEEETE